MPALSGRQPDDSGRTAGERDGGTAGEWRAIEADPARACRVFSFDGCSPAPVVPGFLGYTTGCRFQSIAFREAHARSGRRAVGCDGVRRVPLPDAPRPLSSVTGRPGFHRSRLQSRAHQDPWRPSSRARIPARKTRGLRLETALHWCGTAVFRGARPAKPWPRRSGSQAIPTGVAVGLYDQHLHSRFSVDSESDPVENVRQALSLGLAGLAHRPFDAPDRVADLPVRLRRHCHAAGPPCVSSAIGCSSGTASGLLPAGTDELGSTVPGCSSV